MVVSVLMSVVLRILVVTAVAVVTAVSVTVTLHTPPPGQFVVVGLHVVPAHVIHVGMIAGIHMLGGRQFESGHFSTPAPLLSSKFTSNGSELSSTSESSKENLITKIIKYCSSSKLQEVFKTSYC